MVVTGSFNCPTAGVRHFLINDFAVSFEEIVIFRMNMYSINVVTVLLLVIHKFVPV